MPAIKAPVIRKLPLILLLGLAACAPRLQPAGPPVMAPRLTADRFIATDGAELPVKSWQPAGRARAVFLALHGFNDYSNAFRIPAQFWAKRGIATYAFDQRGFGAAPHTGIWPGIEAMKSDLRAVAAALRARHPEIPLFLLGDSMGGAVIMAAMADGGAPMADGAILAAPAVWGRRHMNPFQRGALWLFAHTLPWVTLTGQGLNIKPSDNIAMLKKLSADPKVIKRTRIDTIWGLVNLMDVAFAAAGSVRGPALVLYGRRDEVVPAEPSLQMMRALPRKGIRTAIYDGAYHMLLRDLKADVALGDIAAWIADHGRALPSGADTAAAEILRRK